VGNPFGAIRSARARAWPAAVLLAALALGAGCERPAASPVAPSAPPPPAPSELWSIEGSVHVADGDDAIAGADIRIAEGANAGRSTTTDEQGHYKIADLGGGALVVHASADGFDLQSQSVTLSSSQTIDFALRRPPSSGEDPAPPRRTLSGTVSNAATEDAIRDARVEVVSGPDKGTHTETDSKGRFSLTVSPGTLAVQASAEGFESSKQSVTVEADHVLHFLLDPAASSDPPGTIVKGSTVDGVSSDGVGGARIRAEGGGETTSGDDGTFELVLRDPDPVIELTISSSSTVERSTRVRVAGDSPTLTLIPKDLGLSAFDQMFRGDHGVLHRWTSAPKVVVQRRVLQFTDVNDASFTASGELLSDEDVDDLLDDLAWALPQLSGETFQRFADKRVETAAEGERVEVVRSGVIVVAQYAGLAASTAYWGYTRWAWNSRGEVRSAVMMFDRTFETSGASNRRALHAHELGHALGYNHVTSKDSVMNSSARNHPTRFDRDGSRIAFLRPPLNATPDTDPDPVTVNRMPAGGLTWKGDQ
jgi:hypothetical protein